MIQTGSCHLYLFFFLIITLFWLIYSHLYTCASFSSSFRFILLWFESRRARSRYTTDRPTIMGMLMMNNGGSGTSSCIQPSPQVLASLPLLVYEYEDHATDEQPTPPVVDHPSDSTATATATKMLCQHSSSWGVSRQWASKEYATPAQELSGIRPTMGKPQLCLQASKR